MIKIEINAETGIEARGALLELLGLTGETTVSFSDFPKQTLFVNEPKQEDPNVIIGNGQNTAAEIIETAKPKRRTKAEIEAEKTSIAEAKPEIEPTIEQANEGESETSAETTVTKEDLQKKAVELGRVGKKELCRAVLQKHGADSISTADKNPLKLELYATVLEEFNKL